ncbi:MAG TPA: response regulator [Allosphingosinicella sp.]|jgi:DNA-binding response OmpR family regulator
MHALIVETESLIAHMVQDILEESGFDSFAFAATAAEAIDAAEARCPDLIVADVDLREGCGIEAVQSICSSKPIPVIFAGHTFRDALARVPTAKALRKPFGALGLTAAIAEARAGRGPAETVA